MSIHMFLKVSDCYYYYYYFCPLEQASRWWGRTIDTSWLRRQRRRDKTAIASQHQQICLPCCCWLAAKLEHNSYAAIRTERPTWCVFRRRDRVKPNSSFWGGLFGQWRWTTRDTFFLRSSKSIRRSSTLYLVGQRVRLFSRCFCVVSHPRGQ